MVSGIGFGKKPRVSTHYLNCSFLFQALEGDGARVVQITYINLSQVAYLTRTIMITKIFII
jgi:hypothetical protein